MVAIAAFNPMLTTNASGSFNVESTGYIQGLAMDDPAMRYQLASGILADDETIPMWGGVGIYNDIPGGAVGAPGAVLGGLLGRANTLTAQAAKQLTGFSVFDQAHHMIQSPQSQVPISASKMSVHYYRLGSLARIPLAVDPALLSLQGSIITSLISWDFVAQRLIQGQAAYAANVITAATWANTNGGQATYTTTSAHGILPGTYVTFTGITPAAYNGTFLTIAGTTASTIVVPLPLASTPGAGSAFGTLVAGGGYLNVKILDVRATNNMTVSYDPITGFTNWNRNGACALVQI
jgi:hypothetical protein